MSLCIKPSTTVKQLLPLVNPTGHYISHLTYGKQRLIWGFKCCLLWWEEPRFIASDVTSRNVLSKCDAFKLLFGFLCFNVWFYNSEDLLLENSVTGKAQFKIEKFRKEDRCVRERSWKMNGSIVVTPLHFKKEPRGREEQRQADPPQAPLPWKQREGGWRWTLLFFPFLLSIKHTKLLLLPSQHQSLKVNLANRN